MALDAFASLVCLTVGSEVGPDELGSTLGIDEEKEGIMVGPVEGDNEGNKDSDIVDFTDGITEGFEDGAVDGELVGSQGGVTVDAIDGDTVGSRDGSADG